MRTFVPSATTVSRRWHVIDADGQVLGRVASAAAKLLQGKHRAQYVPFLPRPKRQDGHFCARVERRKMSGKIFRAYQFVLNAEP